MGRSPHGVTCSNGETARIDATRSPSHPEGHAPGAPRTRDPAGIHRGAREHWRLDSRSSSLCVQDEEFLELVNREQDGLILAPYIAPPIDPVRSQRSILNKAFIGLLCRAEPATKRHAIASPGEEAGSPVSRP